MVGARRSRAVIRLAHPLLLDAAPPERLDPVTASEPLCTLSRLTDTA